MRLSMWVLSEWMPFRGLRVRPAEDDAPAPPVHGLRDPPADAPAGACHDGRLHRAYTSLSRTTHPALLPCRRSEAHPPQLTHTREGSKRPLSLRSRTKSG